MRSPFASRGVPRPVGAARDRAARMMAVALLEDIRRLSGGHLSPAATSRLRELHAAVEPGYGPEDYLSDQRRWRRWSTSREPEADVYRPSLDLMLACLTDEERGRLLDLIDRHGRDVIRLAQDPEALESAIRASELFHGGGS